MTKVVRLLCLLSLLFLINGLSSASPALRLAGDRGFEPNRGQSADPTIAYFSRLAGYTVALDGRGASLYQTGSADARPVRLSLGSAATPLAAEGPLPGRVSYFLGNDPKLWHTAIPTFARVRAHEIYPGIDVVYYRNGESDLEHDFLVSPYADPSAITISISGAGSIRLDRGEAVIATGAAEFRLRRPVAYQEFDGTRHDVSAEYVLSGNRLRFRLGAYDRSRPLVIDPAAVFVTYLGGTSDDGASAVAIDGSGNTYVAGTVGVTQTLFPSTAAFNYHTANAAFVTKYDSSGQIVYSALISGYVAGANVPAAAYGTALAVDASGRAIVGGRTNSINYPVVNGYSSQCGVDSTSGAAFITQLNATGDALAFSTCLSGPGYTSGPVPTYSISSMTVDGVGSIYVGGIAAGDFITTTPRLASCTAQNCLPPGGAGFVAKIDPTKTGTASLVYSTFIANYGANIYAVAVQKGCVSDCSLYVAGENGTEILDTGFIITPGTISSGAITLSSYGRFISKINASATALEYSTLLTNNMFGIIGAGYVKGLAVDASGNAYVAGSMPYNGTQAQHDPVNALVGSCYQGPTVSKVNPTANAYIYQSCFGVAMELNAIAVNDAGEAFVTGYVLDYVSQTDPLGASSNALQTQRLPVNSADAFLSRINAAGTQLTYSTYVGGASNDYANAIALAGNRVAITGTTNSIFGFPAFNAIQPQNNSTPVPGVGVPTDAFLAVFDFSANATPAVSAQLSSTSLNFGDQRLNLPSYYKTITVTAAGNTPLRNLSVSATGDFGAIHNCPSQLGVTATCTISVWFNPTVLGSRTGSLTITSNGSGSPQTVSLAGNGVGIASYTRSGYVFPQTVLGSTSAAQTITISSNGTGALVISNVYSTSTEFTPTTDCNSPLPAGSSCHIFVTFTPADIGTRTGTLMIFSNIPTSPDSSNLLTAVGAAPVPTLASISPTKGTVGRQSMLLTLTGANFIKQSTVTVGGQGRIVTYVDSTTLQVALISSDFTTVTTRSVVVTNPTPGGGTTAGVNLNVVANTAPEGAFEIAESESSPGSTTLSQLQRFRFSGWAGDPDEGTPLARVQVVVTPVDTTPANGVFVFMTGKIRRLSPAGIVSTYAGTGTAGHSGDNNLATAAAIAPTNAPSFDAAGNLYIPENTNPYFYIRKVDASTGNITTWAGNGTISAGVNVAATSTGVPPASNVVFDSSGNGYVSIGTQVRKIAVTTTTVTNYAGTGASGNTGDNGQATSATFCNIVFLAIDSSNNLFLSDSCNNNVRKINNTTKVVTLVAGANPAGFSGDGGLATSAQMNNPGAIAVNAAGDVFIADRGNSRIRKVNASDQKISTFAGGTGCSNAVPAPSTSLCVVPVGLGFDSAGNLFINSNSNANSSLYKVDTGGTATLFAGSSSGSTLDDGLGIDTKFDSGGVAVRGTTSPWWTQDATQGATRSDVVASTGHPEYINSGWSTAGYAVPLPPGPYNVRAFAYDFSNARTRLAADKSLTLTAQSGSYAYLSASTLDFGTVGPTTATVVKAAQLSNLGSTTLNISSIGVAAGWSRTTTCGSTLAVGATCSISISFVPTQFGTNLGSLQVTSDGVNGQASASLTGKFDQNVTVARPTRVKRSEIDPSPVLSSASPASVSASPNPTPQYFVFSAPATPDTAKKPGKRRLKSKAARKRVSPQSVLVK